MQISGEIVVGADCVSFGNATAFIYLEDVGRADAPSQMLGRAKLSGAMHEMGSESRIPFAVETADNPDTGEVAIRVHVSLDGHEDVAAGDLVSTSHTQAVSGQSVDVAVRTV